MRVSRAPGEFPAAVVLGQSAAPLTLYNCLVRPSAGTRIGNAATQLKDMGQELSTLHENEGQESSEFEGAALLTSEAI